MKVLIVHGSDAMAAIIEMVVREAGCEPVRARTGHEALRHIAEARTAIVDVAISDPYAFELVPALKQQKSLFVVLLASVYDKTAYKRRPGSLYGADDYLEQHHIPDKLPLLLSSLSAVPTPHDETTDPHVKQKREQLRRAADEQLGNSNRTLGPDASAEALAHSLVERARALANKLVLDISLYHDAAFVAGLDHGDLAERLGSQLKEAKRFLAERLPDSFRPGDAERFVDEALVRLQRERKGGGS